MKSLLLLALIGLLAAPVFTGCHGPRAPQSTREPDADARPPLRTVPHVDLARYLGEWRVIAHLPYFADTGKVDVRERYTRRADGKIEATMLFRQDAFDAKEQAWHAVAEVTNPTTNAEWQMQFFWPFKLDYRVIDLAPDYHWAVVGHPSRDYLWVLARSPTLSPATYEGILRRAAAQGFDVTQLTKVPQPET